MKSTILIASLVCGSASAEQPDDIGPATSAKAPSSVRVVAELDLKTPRNEIVPGDVGDRTIRERKAQLLAGIRSFAVHIDYEGNQGKPFYRLTMAVRDVKQPENPFHPVVRLSDAEARVIIAHLANEGFLRNAANGREQKRRRASKQGYRMTVAVEGLTLFEHLGWDLEMLGRLDALSEAMPKAGQQDLDFLLQRLSGLRAQWEARAKQER